MPKRTCSIEGCERPHRARGWCNKHWLTWRRHGDPLYQPPTVEERFWSYVDKDGPVPPHRPELGPCWIWIPGPSRRGYGQFSTGGAGQSDGAHRAAWMLQVGPIPVDRPCVCHACDNKICVRRSHLFVGTYGDNNRDRARKGRSAISKRTHCKRGHPFDEVNTYVRPTGKRACRACRLIRDRRSVRMSSG